MSMVRRMIDANIIAKRAALELRGALAANQTTMTLAAKRTGHTIPTVGRWLAGKHPMPMPAFIAICYVANTTPEEIMRRASIGAALTESEHGSK